MATLAKKEYCTGCMACASACHAGCIAMVTDENGFYHPSVDTERCVGCGLCEKSCPVVTPMKMSQNEPRAYAAYSKDIEMRRESSSGGVFTELANVVLKNGGAIFGAAYNENFEVVHICAENDAELEKLRGAKYSQSDLRNVFLLLRQMLESGREVLFSGTPCQVGGLKAFLQKEYENLTTVDFVCHSIPSPLVWKEYVKYRAVSDNSGDMPAEINMRSKISGWSRYRYSNQFEYKNGISHIDKNGESLYMKLFVGGYISREACAKCGFKGYGRVSDLTIGDFWGIWNIDPEMDDDMGTSVVLVHSARGDKMLFKIMDKVILKEVTLEEAGRENPAMLKASQPNKKRSEVLNLIKKGHIAACEKCFDEAKPSSNLITRILRRLTGN